MSESISSVAEFRTLSLFSNLQDITDGVPVLPVSKERLAGAIAVSGRPGDERIGSFPGREPFTVSELTELALLAGCREDYMPLIIAAFEAMLDPSFPIALFTQSRASFFPYLIVNGPVRHQLGINCRSNVFSPGFRANATIGRAVRLGLSRFAGAAMDKDGPSALGTAYRYACVVGEDEENSPWPPLHTEFGLEPHESSVMVLAAWQPAHVTNILSGKAEELVRAYADELVVATRFHALDVPLPEGGYAPKAIVVVGEDHRGFFRDAGWDRGRIRAALHEAVERDPGSVRAAGYSLEGPHAPQARANGRISPYSSADDFYIVSAGSGGGLAMIGGAVFGKLSRVKAGQSLPVSASAGASGSMQSVDDFAGLVARYMDGDATDGWPIIPPDAEGVGALVAASGRGAADVIGGTKWRPAPITVQDIAINACMAGCLPEHMPLLTPMFETLFSPEAEGGISLAASIAGFNCWFVVHGPIAQKLAINGGNGLFGPGAYANVALGRAVRLALMNLGGLKTNLMDRSCLGQAYKYGTVFADEKSPWGPLDPQLGPDKSGFSLIWGYHTRLIVNEEASSAEQLLLSIADSMSTVQNYDSPAGRLPGETKVSDTGQFWIELLRKRELYIVMSRDHRALLEGAGWGIAKVQHFLHEHCARSVGDLRRTGYGATPLFEYDQEDRDSVPLVTAPAKIIPVAAGGSGGATIALPALFRVSRPLSN